MNLHRSLAVKTVASLATASLLFASGGAALAQEESPSPEASPETTQAEPEAISEEGGHQSGPKTPKDNTFALGQSMQIRVNADAEPNSSLLDFRWSVSQLTAQGPPDGSKDGDYTIPVPEGGDLPRYLNKFGFIDVEDGEGQWEVTVEDGFATARSVSLYPQDAEVAVDLEAEFTLDGEPVTAQDIVGKSGVVTATYTLTNNTTSPTEVTVENLAGEPVTTTVEADVPLVAIAKTLLPYRFTGLNTGSGIQGADGRGNNQVQWIALPFRPLSGDGKATFGWSAHVTDGLIPSMLIQVAVLHIPAHEDDPATPEDESAPNGSQSPVNLDPAVAEIQSGLANVVGGIDQLTSGGGEDPLKVLEGRLNEFFSQFGTNLQDVAQNLQPTIDGLTEVVSILQQIEGPLTGINERWDEITSLVEFVSNFPGGATALSIALSAAGLPDGPPCGDGSGSWSRAEAQCLIDTAAAILPQLGTIGGQISVIAPLVTTLVPVAEALLSGLTGLQQNLQIIGGNLPTAELPTLDSVINSVIASILSSPGGQQLTTGLGQVSSGVSAALAEVSAFAAQAIAALQGGVADADQVLVNLKASIAGLLAKSAESPLIYGPLPEGTPEDTVLAGAYEFRVDAADTNMPYTLPRILVGLLALIAGGLVVKLLGSRSSA